MNRKRGKEERQMADDLSKRGKADQLRVNVHEDWEMRERSKEWNVTPQQIKDAVKKVGPMVKDVKRELGK
jgi:predicted DNA-binding protein YlxM (UPF0122 family)